MPNKMRPGAIAFIDFLGSRGIWNRHDPVLILHSLKQLQDVVNQHNAIGMKYIYEEHQSIAPHIKVEAIFISDTVCLACWYDFQEEQEMTLCPLVYILGKVAANLIRESALVNPPRSLRGCISTGLFSISGNFLIGPAVDEAAEYMDVADGAFTFLTPSAENCVKEAAHYIQYLLQTGQASEQEQDEGIDLSLFLPYEVPIKNGVSHTAPVLNPLACEMSENQATIIDRILRSFDINREDVRNKMDNTKKFLAESCPVKNKPPL